MRTTTLTYVALLIVVPFFLSGQTKQYQEVLREWSVLQTQMKDAFFQRKTENALPVAKNMLVLAEKSNSDSLLLQAYGILIVVEPNQKLALQAYQKKLSLLKQKGVADAEIQVLVDMSMYLKELGEIPNAYKYGKRLLSLAEQTSSLAAKQQSGIVLATLYQLTGDYRKSIQVLKLAVLDSKKTLKSDKNEALSNQRLAEIWLGIGLSFRNLHQLDSAQFYTQKAFQLAKSKKLPAALLRAYLIEAGNQGEMVMTNPASIYKFKENLDSAAAYLKLNIPELTILYSQTKAYFLLLSGQIGACIQATDTLLQSGLDRRCTASQRIAYNLYYYAYQYAGDPVKALTYYQKFVMMNDSIRQNEVNYRLGMYEIDQEVQKKEIQNLQLKHQAAIANQRNYFLIIGLAGFAVLSLLTSIFARQWRFQAVKNKTLAKEISEQSEKLKVSNSKLNQFLSVVSHDLLFNFDLILSTGNITVEGPNDVSGLNNYFNQVQQTIKQLKTYCISLLNMAKNEIHLLEPVEIEPLIAEILNNYKAYARNFQIEIVPTQEAAMVVTNRTMLRQALQNVIDNAIKFSRSQDSPRLQIGWKEVANQWQIWVKDNGVGMNDHNLSEISSSTSSASIPEKEAQNGNQMGLSLVKKSLESLGGSLIATSNDWNGATFMVSLPQ